MTASVEVERAFREHERFVWGVCYRMTGDAAEADDLVQETFARALERPPADRSRPWRPWLVRVAVNLSIDALRRRRRRAYVGPWLPSPVDTSADPLEPGPEARYGRAESATFAFLLALEALTPKQRAVLLLRDVLDHSARETAEVLGSTEAAVKVTLHRARKAMAAYDAARCVPTKEHAARARAAMERFFLALAAGDAAAMEAALAEDVRMLNDSAGEYLAARKPVVGRAKVALFHRKIGAQDPRPRRWDFRMLNGMPALVLELDGELAGVASRMVIRADVDPGGSIREIHLVVARDKLAAVGPVASPAELL
jgi:RNA polymerase sigma-70 factor (ECF subfamily)